MILIGAGGLHKPEIHRGTWPRIRKLAQRFDLDSLL